MPLNISKITGARNIFYIVVFLKGDMKVQFGGKWLKMYATLPETLSIIVTVT